MLGAVGLAAVVVLALVFAAAGIAKLADREGTRAAVVAFGVPEWLSSLAALLVPAGELTVAILLVSPGTQTAGAIGSLVVLGLLSTVVALSLGRGRAPECHCFGQLHSAPASWRTLARNVMLASLGAVVLTVDPVRLGSPEILPVAAVTLAFAMLGACTFAWLSLLRSHGKLLLRLAAIERGLVWAGIELELEHDPPVGPGPGLGHPGQSVGLSPGAAAPSFAVNDEIGTAVSLVELLAPGVPLLLVFTSPDCGPCRTLLPQLAGWQHDLAARLTVAVITDGKPAAGSTEEREYGLARTLIDERRSLNELYEASITPSAVLVSVDGMIASFVASGPQAIVRLVDQALTATVQREEQGLPLGAPAPTLRLVGLDGDEIAFTDKDTQEPTLILFWDPACGFCRSMLDELLAWERHAPASAPRLMVISSGGEDATRAEGFASQVALDPHKDAGAAFGAPGTPMAVVLHRGRIASPLAAGADAVLALAGPSSSRAEQVAT